MKNIIVITGGAGFVGSNLIEHLLKKTKYRLISLDDYSAGNIKNHIKDSKIKYINGNTKDISKLLNKYRKNIQSLFHFGEFSRIYQSFLDLDSCLDSNSVGSNAVFTFCLKNKVKLIYSATSAALDEDKNNKNLSPYAFTKSKNLEFLENLKKWFKLKYEVVYFYNVYGPRQIRSGNMATVIGIFEECFMKKKPLPVVKPGTQSRRFTHIKDTIDTCYFAWKQNKCKHYSITNQNSYSILEVAKLFSSSIKLLPCRKGERYASALTKMNLKNKVHKKYGKIQLKNYIKQIISN